MTVTGMFFFKKKCYCLGVLPVYVSVYRLWSWYLCGAGNQTQGLVHAGQALSQLSKLPSSRLQKGISCVFFILQVIVWGNYGRMERKQFMGVARVLLEELDLTTLAVGWYKLFPTSSMVDPATGPLLRQASQLSLESTVGPCGERS